MKNKELQFQLIEKLDRVVVAVEDLVTAQAVTRGGVESLKTDLDNLLKVVLEIEKNEFDSPEDTVRKMKDSVEELKKKLSFLESGPETDMDIVPRTETRNEAAVTQTDPVNETGTLPETETTPDSGIQDTSLADMESGKKTEPEERTETAAGPGPRPMPEPDLSEFIMRPDDEPTSYVTSLTAMAQAQAGEQDMSQVAVSSTAMPDEKVVKQVEQRSDIFTKLKETESLSVPHEQNALQSLVDRLKAGKTVNDACQHASGDIRSCIGINEKFLFVNELFKGNIKEYADMLQGLDEATNEEEMNRVILPLREKHAWNEQSLAYLTLSDILRKKFGCVPRTDRDQAANLS